MEQQELTALLKKAVDIRKDIVTMIHRAGTGHIGGDLSVADILVDLYYRQMNISPENQHDPDRDRFILSKGHSVEALYAVLADKGFFPKAELETYAQYQSKFIGHPNNKIPGIEVNSGSLGHGLSGGVGMALAGRMDDAPYRVYVVCGDGECEEGSVWEAAMAGGHYHLDNLTAFVDRNRLQISGTTEQGMSPSRRAGPRSAGTSFPSPATTCRPLTTPSTSRSTRKASRRSSSRTRRRAAACRSSRTRCRGITKSRRTSSSHRH